MFIIKQEVLDMEEYTIVMNWDAEARVWYAINDDIPMALESDSYDVLVKRVKLAAPEILEMNGENPECILRFISERREEVA